jgi:hypothetical protein
MAWMFRRLLVALAIASEAGIVHGAPLPRHVLIHPETHGLVLVDWTAAVHTGLGVDVRPAGYTEWYPGELNSDSRTGVYALALGRAHLNFSALESE